MTWLPRRWRRTPPGGQRWLVVDVETTGLDTRRDRLLAVAAVALRADAQRLLLLPGDSFERVLLQPVSTAPPDKSNILVHGIGLAQQRAGAPPDIALAEFERFVDGAPLLGYHVAFDRAVLERASLQHLGRKFKGAWADVADLAPVLHADLALESLDAWLAHFGIDCLARHQAAADAWATAELLQRLWPRLVREGAGGHFAGVQRIAARRRWLGG